MVQNIIQIFKKSFSKQFCINLLSSYPKNFVDFKLLVKKCIHEIELSSELKNYQDKNNMINSEKVDSVSLKFKP